MLSVFTYYADFSRKVRHQPGDILMEHCQVESVDRFLHYNYSGNETRQRNRPLEDIRFEDVRVTDLRMPLTLYGDERLPVSCALRGCEFAFAPDVAGVPFLHLCHYGREVRENVRVENLKAAPLIKRWSNDGEIDPSGVVYEERQNPFVVDAHEPFTCKPI